MTFQQLGMGGVTTSVDRGTGPASLRAETRTIDTADGPLGVHLRWADGDRPSPVVLFFHRGPGLDDGSKDAMDIFVRAGFLVIAPDRYYRIGPWLSFDPAQLRDARPDSELAKRFEEVLTGTTDDMVAHDVAAILDDLATDERVKGGPWACVGYCIGARSVMRALADRPDVFAAGAMLHPSFCVTPAPDSPHLAVPTIAGSVYVGIGRADRSSPPEQNAPLIEAVRALGERGVVEVHEGADHGFAVPGGSYHEAAARRSYASILGLFARTFG